MSSPAGRVGPAVCVLGVLSPPNGSQTIKQAQLSTQSNNDFPCFTAEGVGLTSGKWYYEVLQESNGCIQAGYAIRGKFKSNTGRGNGVGDDSASWAIDGSKNKIYVAAKDDVSSDYKTSKGDSIGFALDADAATLIISINGKDVKTVDLKDGSDYAAGDVLLPAISLSGREQVTWRFQESEFKHQPAGYAALQSVPYPFELALDVKAEAPASIADADALDHPTLIKRLLMSYAPTVTTPDADKDIKNFVELRGSWWEYGVAWHLDRITGPVEKLPKAFEGTLPKLKFNSSFARDVDAAKEEFNKMRLSRRQIGQWLAAFMAIYGNETAAKATIDLVLTVESQFDAFFPEGLAKFRYIAACEDRKTNKTGVEYGVDWHLERFVSKIETDRSRMSGSQLETHVAELTKQADMFRKWRVWFVAEVGDLPIHTSKLEELDGYLAKFDNLFDPKAMEADLVAKALEQADKDFEEVLRRGRNDITAAKAEFERFPERAQDKYKTLNKQVEDFKAELAKAEGELKDGETLSAATVTKLKVAALAKSAKFAAWEGELKVATADWSRAENHRLLDREVENEIREINSLLNSGAHMLDHHRVDEALKEAFKAKERVVDLKARDNVLSLERVVTFFNEYNTKIYNLETGIVKWQLDRAVHNATSDLRSAVNTIGDLFNHYRNDEALAQHHKAKELLSEMENKKEWAEIAEVKESIATAKEKIATFLTGYKERVVTKQCEEKIRESRSELESARHLLSHYREVEAIAALAKAASFADELRNDPLLSTMPISATYLGTFADDHPQLQREANKAIVEREVTEQLRVAGSAFTETEDNFSHYRFEMALTSLAKYRELVAALEAEKSFRGHAKVEEFLRESDVRVPAFEIKYRETMLQREYDETIRNAGSLINSANHMFDHSRFEESLAEMHKYREAITALREREEFGALAGGVRDAYVKTATDELIPAWQTKYKETVLGRKADELARELRSAVTTASEHLDHHRHEHFLAALQVVREKAKDAEPTSESPAGSDARLMYELPQVVNAIKDAFDEVYKLSQIYDAKVIERRIDDGIRAADSPLTQAIDLLGRSNFDGALSQFADARAAAADFDAAAFTSARATAWSTDFASRAKDFQSKFDTDVGARRLSDATREVNSLINTAKEQFGHYQNENALASLTKAKEARDSFADEFPGETGTVSGWNAEFADFETQYRERVLTREADEAVSKARAELSFTEGHFDHHRYEMALSSLALARVAGGAVSVDTRFQGLAAVKAFEAEFEPRLKAFVEKFDARMLEREAADLVREIGSTLSEMEDHFSHYRGEAALASYSVAVTRRAALEAGAGERFEKRDNVIAADKDAETRMAAFKTAYFEREVATKLATSTRDALGQLTDGEGHLDHSRFDQALASLHTARESAGAIGADPMLLGLAQVDTFLKDFGARADALRAKINATTRARAQAEAERVASSTMNEAQQLFDHHNHDASLVKFQAAREAVDAFSAEFGSDATAASFIAEHRAKHAAFEKTFAEKVFQQEIDRKIAKAKSRLQTGVDAESHYRYEEAMRCVVEADEAASLLASDDRFLQLASVDAFLKEHATAAKALRAKIDAAVRARAAADIARTTGDLVGTVEQLYAHHRYEDALAAASKAKIALETDVAGEPSLAALATELGGRLQAFRKKFQEEHLGREADALIRGTNSQLDNAEFLLSHHRQEDAMAALQKARESAALLGDDNRFEGIASVDAFFAGWPTKFNGVKTAISEKVLAKRAREAIYEANSPLNEATSYLDKHIHETALERLQTATDKATALKGEADLAELPAVREFLAEFDTKRKALAERISLEVYGREVEAAIRATKSHLSQALAFYERFAYEAALSAFQAARDSVATVNDDDRLASATAWTAYAKGEYAIQSAAFTKSYSEKVLGEEARVAIAAVRAHLAKTQVYLDRAVREKAEESLTAARDAAEQLLDTTGMLSALESSRALVAELRAVQTKFAQLFLQEEAAAAIVAARKQLDVAARAESRALDASEAYKAVQEASAPLLGTSLEAPIAESFAVLPSVVTFVTELVKVLSKAGVEVFTVSGGAGKTSGKKGSGKDDTVDAVLGPRFPLLAVLRKGVPKISVNTELHPKFFSCVKLTNQAGVAIAKEFRELEANATACELGVVYDPYARKHTELFTNGCVVYPMESIQRALVDYGKALATLQADLKDAPEEEVTKTLRVGYETFTQAFNESIATLKKFSLITKRARQMAATVGQMDTILKELTEATCFTQCPFNGKCGKADYEMGTAVVSMAKSATDSINAYAAELNGQFVMKEFFLTAFADRALKAKKLHVDHCIRQVVRNSLWKDNHSKQQTYMRSLGNYPLAQAEAVRQAKVYVDAHNERKSEPVPFNLVAPQATSNPDAAEVPEWYILDHETVPAGAGTKLAFNKWADTSSDGSTYTSALKAVAGKIIYSKSLVANTGETAGTEEKFSLEEATKGNGIFARAFWPRGLRNYALAKRRDTGAPVYGPEFIDSKHTLEILMFVSIDGKQISRARSPDGAFSWFTERGEASRKEKYRPGLTDFYAWSQTCRFQVLASDLHEDHNMRDEWSSAAARYAYEFSKLAPGEHRVETELRFRLVTSDDNALASPLGDAKNNEHKRTFPWINTPISETFSKGGFTLVVPQNKVARRSVLPVPSKNLKDSPADLLAEQEHLRQYFKAARDWGNRESKTEQPLAVALQTDFYVSMNDSFILEQTRDRITWSKEPVQMGRDFAISLLRLKKTGWSVDRVAIFDLAAYGTRCRNPPSSLHPISGTGVGSSYTFDAELLSEADRALENK